jgi:hypothetical protein
MKNSLFNLWYLLWPADMICQGPWDLSAETYFPFPSCTAWTCPDYAVGGAFFGRSDEQEGFHPCALFWG